MTKIFNKEELTVGELAAMGRAACDPKIRNEYMDIMGRVYNRGRDVY